MYFFTLEPFKGAEYNEHKENASGSWQASLTMCSLRRFHAKPRKTAAALLLSSKANERALDIVPLHGLRTAKQNLTPSSALSIIYFNWQIKYLEKSFQIQAPADPSIALKKSRSITLGQERFLFWNINKNVQQHVLGSLDVLFPEHEKGFVACRNAFLQ